MSNYSDSLFSPENTNNSWYKALNMIPEGSLVLDVGCSSGNFGDALIRLHGCTVDGIELNEEDAKLASHKLRKLYKLNIETDNLHSIDNTYDAINFGDVIEHLSQPVEVLKKIKKLLKPSGMVVFSIPNMAYLMIRLQLLKGEFDYTETGILDKTHLHFYTLKEIQTIFAEAGYEIKKIDYVEKDYPNKFIESYLNEIGLKPEKKFFHIMHQPEAAAFQIVGFAKASDIIKPIRFQFGPIDLYESYFANAVEPLHRLVADLNSSNDMLTKEITRLNGKLDYIHKHPVKTIVKSIIKRK
jgi:2-polyprenyl-3-methyl-5-hydroxy-6-metoxy-1,4-benzoquinol methylase